MHITSFHSHAEISDNNSPGSVIVRTDKIWAVKDDFSQGFYLSFHACYFMTDFM